VDGPVVSLAVPDWIVVGVYIAGMLGIGIWFSRRKETFEDYFMAGRGVRAPLLVATLVSTFYGLDTLFGTSEVGYYEGIAGFFAYSLPYTALYIVMAFVAPKFKRRFPEHFTMQEIARRSYGKTAGATASAAAYIYSTNTMEMMGIGFLLHLITGMPFWIGVLIGAALALAYTWLGGLWADIMTDFVQFVVMMIAVGIGLVVAWTELGGFDGIWKGLQEFTGESNPDYYFDVSGGYLTPWTLVAYGVTSLAVLTEPAFFQRIFASAGPKEIKKAFAVGVPMWLSFDWCVTFLGIAGAAAIGLGVIPEVEPNEALFAVWGEYLPAGLLGLATAGVFAAAMSTADSYFLVAGGVIGFDVYKGLMNPQATDKRVERLTKIGMLVSAAISVGLAFVFERIMGVWVFQATVIICTCLVPIYFAAFRKKKPKKVAGSIAMLSGLLLSVVWYAVSIVAGHFDEDVATYIVTIGGVDFWQEYGILMITPLVFVIYVVASFFGREVVEEEEVA